MDKNGNTLSAQEVYRGKSAKAPAAPSVTDMVFAGWDTDFSNVQSDLTVRPLYNKMAEYTVTFKDQNGTVLKTQKVISGRAATAPSVSDTAEQIFVGWDKSFTNVTSDLVVTAKYRAKNTYTVTFKDYNGLVLGTASVKEKGTAVSPVTPTREGYTFTGWSSSLSNITTNKTVTAQYRLNSGNNVIDVSYKVNTNKTVTITFTVKGSVKFAAMEGYVELPARVSYQSHTEENGATLNHVDGTLFFMFASNSGGDVTTDTVIMTVTLAYTGDPTTFALNVVIEDIYDQKYQTVPYVVIGTEIKVK